MIQADRFLNNRTKGIPVNKQEINQIIEENVLVSPPDSALFEIREKIMLHIVERPPLSPREENRLDLVRMVIALEGKANAFTHLFQDQEGEAAIEIAIIEQLLVLYESCEMLCGFLVDRYDVASESLKTAFGKDELIALAADLRTEREETYKAFAEKNPHPFPIVRLATFHNLTRWTMLALLGEEKYCCLMAEANDAFAVLRSHPKFA